MKERKRHMNELAYGATDTGMRRDNNEDALLLLPEKHIYIISHRYQSAAEFQHALESAL